MAYDIFLSYRRSDQAIARAIVGALEERGLAVWWDQNIEGGQDWRDAIVAGLTDSNALVILFSDDCNSSKQLKKEIAVADTLDKLVVPVLIENTQPKGHFLYELAARNWIQVFPNPQAKTGELADRLAREVADLRPDGASPAPAMAQESIIGEAPAAAQEPGATPVAAPPAERSAPAEARTTARKVEAATARKKKREERKKTLRDFLPFRWIDIFPLALGMFVLLALQRFDPHTSNNSELIGMFVGWAALIMAGYGALVFPIRYFMRGRRITRALLMYVLSSIVLFGMFFIGVWIWWEGDMEGALEDSGIAAVIWAIFAVVAMGVYAIAHGQRMVRSFRKNVEVL